MSDEWLAMIWIALFLVVGVVTAIGLLARARTLQARALAEHRQRYQELAERGLASQEETNAQLAQLTERVGAVERLLREVG